MINMSVAHVASPGNVLHPQQPLPRDHVVLSRMLEVDTDEASIDVSVSVVRMAVGAASDTEAGIVSARRRAAGGYTIEFVSREKRDAALKAMRDYGQIPAVRPAEAPTVRSRARLGAIDCVPWVRDGKCTLEPGCPFRHPPPVARVPCRHWIRNRGECWYAEHCNFLHPGNAVAATHHDKGPPSHTDAGPAVMMPPSPRQSDALSMAMSPQQHRRTSADPWASSPSSSVIPSAAIAIPAKSPRDAHHHHRRTDSDDSTSDPRTIGSPWTARAKTAQAAPAAARPASPDVFGRPVHHAGAVPDAIGDRDQFQVSSSISSVDDEIVPTRPASEQQSSVAPISPYLPRRSSEAGIKESSLSGTDSVWAPTAHGSPNFNQKRLDFGLADTAPADDETTLLRQQLAAKDKEISRMARAASDKDRQIAFLSEQLAALHARANVEARPTN